MNGLTVGHLAVRNARKRPDTEALVEYDEGRRDSCTFSEFEDRTNRVANALSGLGVGHGDMVAMYMKNSTEVLETFLGAMKIGALPVPVNHRFKGDEVAYVLSDSGARVCVVDDFGTETVESVAGREDVPVETYLHVGTDTPRYARPYEAQLEAADDEPVDVVPGRLDDAGLMYTSGTTGRPKGCVYTHENFVQVAADGVFEDAAYLAEGNRHLIVTPLFHVGAFVPFLKNFYVGGTTVVVSGFDPGRTMQLMETERINSTFLVPTQSRQLLDLPDFGSYDISSLKNYMTGSAPSEAELKREIIERFDCALTESFGQTEVLYIRLPPERTLEKTESVGRPILSLEMKVCDEEGNQLPRGEVGRAAYRGPTVFRGYLNRPDRTAEVFDDGWFVSSDLVERDEEGFVYFVGRADDMIVTGGENVHPAEITDALQDHPEIDEASVVGVPDETWGERIKAAVVLEDGASLDADDVVEFVGENLAGYKKPREVEFYEELPRNPTGKVIRDELR